MPSQCTFKKELVGRDYFNEIAVVVECELRKVAPFAGPGMIILGVSLIVGSMAL